LSGNLIPRISFKGGCDGGVGFGGLQSLQQQLERADAIAGGDGGVFAAAAMAATFEETAFSISESSS